MLIDIGTNELHGKTYDDLKKEHFYTVNMIDAFGISVSCHIKCISYHGSEELTDRAYIREGDMINVVPALEKFGLGRVEINHINKEILNGSM